MAIEVCILSGFMFVTQFAVLHIAGFGSHCASLAQHVQRQFIHLLPFIIHRFQASCIVFAHTFLQQK